MSLRKRPAPLKEHSQPQPPSRIAEAINQRLQQYLEAKDFHFASLGDNAIVMRKRVIVQEHPTHLNISRIVPPQQHHKRSSISHHEHSHRDNYSMLPRQIRNEIQSLKVTIQSHELRNSQDRQLMEKHTTHESVQNYVQYSKIRASALRQSSILATGGVDKLIAGRIDKQEKQVRLPPLIEVKSLAPYEGSVLLGIKVPESIRSEIAKSQHHQQPRRFSKKLLDDRTRTKIHSSNNLKLKYEEEMKDLLDYREKNKRNFNDRFYELQELINEQVRKQTEEVRSNNNSIEQKSIEEITTEALEHITEDNVVVVHAGESEQPPEQVSNDQDSPKRSRNPVRLRAQIKAYRPPKELNGIYQNKMKNYREFLFQVNLAHGRYDPIITKEECNMFKNDWKFRAYVGRGNNSLLIKGLLKRRFWWIIDEEAKNCQFVWTQLKMNSYYELEAPAIMENNPQEQPLQEERKHVASSPRKTKKQVIAAPGPQPTTNKYKPVLPSGVDKIFTRKDQTIYRRYEQSAQSFSEEKLADFDNRLKLLDKKLVAVGDKHTYRLHNHLEFNYYMGNKKAMFYNMRQYYQLTNRNVFDHLPLTFHIKKGLEDREYKHFLKQFKRRAEEIRKLEQQQHNNNSDDETEQHGRNHTGRNIWIVKPGELSNRGSGITVVDELYELNNILKKKEQHANGTAKTFIVQAYLDRPLLYHGRKFDLRHYMLITTLYGKMRAYWYSEGYVRTSSAPFDLDDLGNDLIHLTNDAIQKHGEDYGRFEEGNKLSYLQLQRYLDSKYPKQGILFYEHIYPQMRQVALDAVRASYMRLDPRRLQHNFQILGLDFMIDRQFKVWLIEINTNPCLEISSVLLGRIIPTMVQHSFRLTLDVLFPPPAQYPNTLKHLAPDKALDNLKFELIFDEESEAAGLRELYHGCKALQCGDISEQDETFDNDGKEVDLDLN